ncbi:MAG TPA: response regulator [Gemmatimonadales bacterium]|nr:response regulator [Gemmatimonadales bacterium]
MSAPAIGARADLLLVEPDPAEAELASRCLRTRIAVAHDVSEAFRAVETLQPRMVLLNPRVPGGDGLTLVGRLRADARFRTLPIVVLSSDDTPEEVARALVLGANSVVHKPVSFEAFRSALAEVESYWLGRHAPG